MNLENIREELRRLSALVAGWSAEKGISALERDLALEKLRALYDAVRFVGDESAPEPVAVDFNLGGILLLDPESDPEPAPEVEHETFEPFEPSEPSDLEPAPESAPEVESEAVPESVPEVEPEVVLDAEPEAEQLPATESVFEEAPAESVPAAAPEPVEVPESIAMPAPEPVVAPALDTAPEPVAGMTPMPHPVEATLFGLEEDDLRHRRKQRVIMSLYDTGEPAPKPAPMWPAPSGDPVADEAEEPAAAPETEVSGVPEISDTPDAPETPETPETPGIPEQPDPAAASEPEAESAAAEPVPEAASAATSPVLGDVINHDVQTLSDTIEPPRDVASELRRREPVTDLGRAIGINDKFLLIRDLFAGDGASYEEAVRTLNAFDDLDDCMIYIAEHYAWNPNSDGAKLLMELLERKFA